MVHSSCSITSNDVQVIEKFEIFGISSLTLGTTVVLILFFSILWTKQQIKHQTIKTRNNILSLNQTVAVRVWLLADFFSFQLILNMIPPERMVQFEMMKIIVDNICYRFLLPLILLISTKNNFPELWTDGPMRKRRDFYQTEMKIIPRRPEPTEDGEPPRGSGARYVYVRSVKIDVNMN